MTEKTFSDTRDGKTYKTIEVNGLIWMAENLNFETEGSWWYQDNEANGKKYGRLYTWDAAVRACPSGWRLPTNEEWQELIESYGGLDSGYEAVIEGGQSGIDILLGGYRDLNGKFGRAGAYGGYWTEKEDTADRAWGLNIDGYYKKLDIIDGLKGSGRSCRCIKNV